MKTRPDFRILAVPILFLAVSATSAQQSAYAQDEKRGSWDIQAKEATQGRPQGTKPPPDQDEYYQVRQTAVPDKSTRTRPRRRGGPSRQKFPAGRPAPGTNFFTLGITFWRVREATPAELKEGKVVTERMRWEGQDRDVVVTRMTDEQGVASGEFIQMTIEYLPESGKQDNHAVFLYVINCEQMADGSWQNARLIFPTQNTHRGDNRLLPGQTVTIPDSRRPFVITRNSNATQQYETYLIIMSPVRLTNRLPQEVGIRAMDLPSDLAHQWSRQWGGNEVRGDLRSRLGQSRTRQELRASGNPDQVRSTQDPDEPLTRSDPPPQTLFRKVVKPGETMLVTINLPFKQTAVLR